jgi:hypothetical protein
MAHRQGFFLAETGRFQLRVGYTQGLEFMEHGFGASFAERQVVCRRSPFAGITLDQYVPVWVASEILGESLQKRLIKWLSEPPNAWVKSVLGFRQFSMRGLAKAQAEWKLVCTALNLRRMAKMMYA